MHEYKCNGTCSTKINFELKNGKVHDVSFENGCNGNLKAIAALVEGMDADKLVSQLKGICCGNKNTSCGDQLAKAVEDAAAGFQY